MNSNNNGFKSVNHMILNNIFSDLDYRKPLNTISYPGTVPLNEVPAYVEYLEKRVRYLEKGKIVRK